MFLHGLNPQRRVKIKRWFGKYVFLCNKYVNIQKFVGSKIFLLKNTCIQQEHIKLIIIGLLLLKKTSILNKCCSFEKSASPSQVKK